MSTIIISHNNFREYVRRIEKIAKRNDERISTFPVKDNNERLVSLRSLRRLYFDDERNKYLVREGVHKRIIEVQDILKEHNLSLYVCDAFRSITLQKKYWDESVIATQKRYPTISDLKEIIKLTAMFTAPVERAQHCTGGSVDVLLYDLGSNTVLDDFDESFEGNFTELVYTDNPEVVGEERKHRNLLKSSMESVGFVNYPLEWWHYSYGNAEWAIYSKKDHAIYGLMD